MEKLSSDFARKVVDDTLAVDRAFVAADLENQYSHYDKIIVDDRETSADVTLRSIYFPHQNLQPNLSIRVIPGGYRGSDDGIPMRMGDVINLKYPVAGLHVEKDFDEVCEIYTLKNGKFSPNNIQVLGSESIPADPTLENISTFLFSMRTKVTTFDELKPFEIPFALYKNNNAIFKSFKVSVSRFDNFIDHDPVINFYICECDGQGDRDSTRYDFFSSAPNDKRNPYVYIPLPAAGAPRYRVGAYSQNPQNLETSFNVQIFFNKIGSEVFKELPGAPPLPEL